MVSFELLPRGWTGVCTGLIMRHISGRLIGYAPPEGRSVFLLRPSVSNAQVFCPYLGECLYNLLKLGDSHNAKSDTKADTKRKTWKKKSPLGSGSVNNAERWT